MKNKFARFTAATIGVLAFSCCICGPSFVCNPVLRPFSKTWATRAACHALQHLGPVPRSRVHSCQNVMRNCFRKCRCANFSDAHANFHLMVGSTIVSAFETKSALSWVFLAGHAPRLFALFRGSIRRQPGSVIYCRNPCYGRRLQLQPNYFTVGTPTRMKAATGRRIMRPVNTINASSVFGNAVGSSTWIHGGLRCSATLRKESDRVEMAVEVVPSRVKGPVSGCSVCLLHGLLGSRRNMRTLGSFLSSPCVLAWDLRNHGQSAWRETMSVDELAGDVLYSFQKRASLFRRQRPAEFASDTHDSALSQNHVRGPDEPPIQVVLVGHSLGGLTAMRAAVVEASRQLYQSPCSAPQSLVRIAGIVVLDIAPVDYTTTAEQERFRAHQVNMGVPRTEDIVRLLNDLPMHVFRTKKQLEKNLLASTDPSLPPRLVSWLMTGVLEMTADGSGERSSIHTQTNAAGTQTSEGRSSFAVRGNVVPGRTGPGSSEACMLRWRMNISAIHRMLASNRLRWHYPDLAIPAGTEQRSHRGAPEQPPPGVAGDLPESPSGLGTFAFYRPSNDRVEAHPDSRLQPHRSVGVYEGPTLFLKGSESPYIDLEKHWGEILKVFPNATCKVVSGAGHWLHADKPQLTADYINEFLTSV